ncbi:MAG: hypothetical protein ACRD15_16095 [Vicinamibacterales bacterium]
MLRNLIRLAVVLLAAHALYRFAPPYIHYHQFKDAVAETALFARGRSESEIVDRVMELAARYEIPIDRDAVQVTKENQVTSISIAYVEQIEWLPSYKRPMSFTITSTDGR